MLILAIPFMVIFFATSLLYWSVRSDHPEQAWFWNPTWQLGLGEQKPADRCVVPGDNEQERRVAA